MDFFESWAQSVPNFNYIEAISKQLTGLIKR